MRNALILSTALLLALAGCNQKNEAETHAANSGGAASAAATGPDPGEGDVQPESLLPDPQTTDLADLPRTITVDNDVLKADVKFDEAIFSFAPAIAMDVVEDARIRLDAMQSDATEYKAADPEYFRPYGLKIDWMVSGAAGNLAGLEGFQYTFTGGAHGNYATNGRIYDTLTGDRLRLANLFEHPEDAAAALAPTVYRAIATEKAARNPDVGNYDTFLGETQDAIAPSDILSGEVSLVRSTEEGRLGGFTLHFGPYEIGSYAEGAYHIAVPQSAFHEYLKPEYDGLFAGEPAKLRRPDD